MGSFWLFVVTSFLLNGSLRGQETNFTSGCLWDKMYSLSCTSAGITNLQDVGLESKKLSSWPRSPRLLKTMKHINLSNNMISSLQLNIFYKFLSLETLNVSNNYISMVSMSYEQQGKDAVLSSLHTLVIERNRLSFVPKGLGKLPSLRTLHLSANSIVLIQRDDFANCTQLQNLDLGDNRIHKIDLDAFRDLRNLQVLRLSNNALVSINPLVFLYSHVLRADIDLSYNRWACDCRILPMKQLLTSLPMGIKKDWNVTCNTPLSRTGNPLLSIDQIDGSCKSPVDKYISARKIVFKTKETMYLPCNITGKTGHKKAFWWTPLGIISGEPSTTNHYIDRMYNLILPEPHHSHEGLYICITDTERIEYQVHFQTDAGKTLIRRPRDVQLRNARIRTEEDFSRAVALSVVISFICAFLLGVFLRPYLERLWRKLCKSKDSTKKTTDEAYDNEGFSEENVSRRQASNGPGGSLPVYVSKDNSSRSDSEIEEPDGSQYVNITYNEREIRYKDEQSNPDIEVHTRSELQQTSDVHEYDDVDKTEDLHSPRNSHLPKSKRVTWASKEESSPTVNLKHVMSLLKPINIIAPAIQMENTDDPEESIRGKPEHGYSDNIPKKNRGSFSDATSDESEFWDAEDLLSDEDIVVNLVSTQQVGSASNGHVIPTVNLKYVMSLLKPINFIVPGSTKPEMAENHYEDLSNSSNQFIYVNQDIYDSSLSDDGSSSSDEDHSSKEHFINNTTESKDNYGTNFNMKQAMSLVKPINIIVPEFTTYDIVKSPTQKQLFPIGLPRYPEYRTETHYYQDMRLSGAPENQPTKDTLDKMAFCDSSSSDDETRDYSKSFISPSINRDVKQTLYDSTSSEDGSADGRSIISSVLLTTKQETKQNDSPIVNLKHVMSLVKPINIIIPGPTMSDLVKSPAQMPFYPSSISRYPGHRMEEIDNLNYQDVKQWIEDESHSMELSYHSSSPDDGSIDFDYDSSDEAVTLNSVLFPTKQASWKTNIDTRPTVNLQQAMSLLKPINIIAPKSSVSELEGNLSQEKFYSCDISKQLEERMEERDDPHNHYQDNKQSSIRLAFSDSSLSEDESKEDEKDHSSDEGSIIPSVIPWPRKENTTPTVNLKHLMSLVKPINITIPEFTVSDIVKSLSQIQFFPTSVPRYQEHRMEDVENLQYHQDIKLDPENNPYNKTQSYNETPPSLINDEKGKKLYDSSSSDEGSDFDFDSSSDDEVKLNPGLPPIIQASWLSDIDTRPSVNLQQVISLLKPINIVVPQFENRIEEKESLQQCQEPGNQPSNLKYEHSFILSTRPANDMEDKQTSSDSSSSDDDSDKKDRSSDDGSIIPSVLLTKQSTWAKEQQVSPTVNLRHLMSLVKPINITIPESTNTNVVKSLSQTQFFPGSISRYPEHRMEDIDNLHYYQNMKVSGEPENKPYNKNQSYDKGPNLPISDAEGKKTFYETSSLDVSTADSSDEEVKLKPGLPLMTQTSWTSNIDTSPTVNLQQVISLLKPINFVAPKFENRIEERESILKQSQEPGNQSSNPKSEPGFILSTRPTNDMEDKQTSSDSSSSDDDSKEDKEDRSSDDESIIPSVLLTKQSTWAKEQKVSPTVNLRHLMSLVKPINITIPESTSTNVVKSLSQTQFFPSSISRYPEHRMEDIDNLHYYLDMKVSGEPENKPYNENQSYDKGPNLPISDEERKKTFYETSSSDVSNGDSSDEEVKLNPPITQASWTSNIDTSPTVNLQQVISLLKPINFVAPKFENRIEERESLLKQSQEPGNQSSNPKSEPGFILSTRPTNDIEDKQTSSDSSSSDDESKGNEEDHSSDNGSIIPSVLLTKQANWPIKENTTPIVNLRHAMALVQPINITFPEFTVIDLVVEEKQTSSESSSSDEESKEDGEDHSCLDDRSIFPSVLLTKQATWTKQQNDSPTVNLRHVMSLVKPINIIIPEASKIDSVNSPSQIQFFPGSISRYPEHRMEDLENLYNDQDITLSAEPENKPYNKNQSYNKSPTLPISDGEGKKMFYDSSSSDDSKENSSDEDGTMNSGWLLTNQPLWTRKGNESPKVNLQQVISLIKPINIIVPDYSVPEPVGSPLDKQLFPTGSIKYGAGNLTSSATLTNDSEGEQTFYGSSSSEDESKDDEDHSSDKESIKNSELFITAWRPKESVSPTLNLRHAMSLVRPISIIVPEYTASEKLQSAQKELLLSGIPRKPKHKIEDIQLSRRPEHQSHNANNESHETLSSPTGYEESMQRVYDSSLLEDESKKDHSSDEGGVMDSYLSTTKLASWTSKEDVRPSINLKREMSLVKPINIVSPESDLKIYYPHDHLYIKQYEGLENQSPDPNDEKQYSEILTRSTKHDKYKEILYDSSLSDDDSDKEGDKSSDKGGGMNSALLLTKNGTWASTEDVSTKVNLKSVMALVNPVNIKAPDSTVTEALRRFKEKYDVQICRHQTLHQLQNTTFLDPSVDKLHSPKTIREDESKHFVYEMGQDSDHPSVGKLHSPKTIREDESKNFVYEMGHDSDTYKEDSKQLIWDYNENSNPKVNLKHTMSLLKPIHIMAPDSTSTMAMMSPEQKYIFNTFPSGNRMENVDYHHDQDIRFHRGNSREQSPNTSFKGLNSFNSDNRSSEDESSQISYKSDIKNSDHLTPQQATPASSDHTSPKLNLKHIISLVKPINIVAPDSTPSDMPNIPTKVLLADRLSHNTISEYYTDTINDTLSDDGSFFSFSKSNSLSGVSEKIDIAADELVGMVDIQTRNSKKEMDKDKISLPTEDNGNALPGTRKSVKRRTVCPNPNMAQRDEDLKAFAGGGYELNKAKDVLHWLNTNTNDETNNEFLTSKTISTRASEQEPVLDLNTHEWTTRTIVRKETPTVSTYESQTLQNETYLITDIGETSTDANLLDFNSNDSAVSSTVDHSMSEHHGSYYPNRRRGFNVFSESLKE